MTPSAKVSLDDRLEIHDARIVDQYIEASEMLLRLAHRALRLFLRGEIGLDDKGIAAPVADLRGKRLEPVFTPGRDRDLGSRFSQRKRRGLTDAGRCACDESNTAIQVLVHGDPPRIIGSLAISSFFWTQLENGVDCRILRQLGRGRPLQNGFETRMFLILRP